MEITLRARQNTLQKFQCRFCLVIPGVGKNVFIYFCVAFMLRFASEKQDQYPLRNVSGASKRCHPFKEGRKEKREFFYWKIDWHWASVVCNKEVSVRHIDEGLGLLKVQMINLQFPSRFRAPPLTSQNWFRVHSYQFQCKKIALFSPSSCISRFIVDKHSDICCHCFETNRIVFLF